MAMATIGYRNERLFISILYFTVVFNMLNPSSSWFWSCLLES